MLIVWTVPGLYTFRINDKLITLYCFSSNMESSKYDIKAPENTKKT